MGNGHMDPTKQHYIAEATGWQEGIYEDIEKTTGMVASIWRSLMYHEPEFLRHAWSQVKPVLQTREFAAYTIAYRDTLITPIESDIPEYVPADLGVDPSDFTELQAQLARFDLIAPRYHVIFYLLERLVTGRPVGTETPLESKAVTSQFPEWLDADRGAPPTMLSQDEARKVMPEAHEGDFGPMVPTEYRSMAQWPPYLDQAWTDLEPVFDSQAFEDARENAVALVEQYLDRLPYSPQIYPEALQREGFDQNTIVSLQDFLETFRKGGREFMPTLPVYAATVGAAGERKGLEFP